MALSKTSDQQIPLPPTNRATKMVDTKMIEAFFSSSLEFRVAI